MERNRETRESKVESEYRERELSPVQGAVPEGCDNNSCVIARDRVCVEGGQRRRGREREAEREPERKRQRERERDRERERARKRERERARER